MMEKVNGTTEISWGLLLLKLGSCLQSQKKLIHDHVMNNHCIKMFVRSKNQSLQHGWDKLTTQLDSLLLRNEHDIRSDEEKEKEEEKEGGFAVDDFLRLPPPAPPQEDDEDEDDSENEDMMAAKLAAATEVASNELAHPSVSPQLVWNGAGGHTCSAVVAEDVGAATSGFTDLGTLRESLSAWLDRPEAKVATSWMCQACTYVNQLNAGECSLCLARQGQQEFPICRVMLPACPSPLPPFRECQKCLFKSRSTVYIPCQHACFCSDCAASLALSGEQHPDCWVYEALM